MDALFKMVASWREKRKAYAEIHNVGLVALSKNCEEDLVEALQKIADTPVPYGMVEDLTGYALGSLMNRTDIPNVGTAGRGAYRLGDLPFKAGYASEGKLVLALASLLEMEGQGLRRAA